MGAVDEDQLFERVVIVVVEWLWVLAFDCCVLPRSQEKCWWTEVTDEGLYFKILCLEGCLLLKSVFYQHETRLHQKGRYLTLLVSYLHHQLWEGFETGVKDDTQNLFLFLNDSAFLNHLAVLDCAGRTHGPAPQNYLLYPKLLYQLLHNRVDIIFFVGSKGYHLPFGVAAAAKIKGAEGNPQLENIFHMDEALIKREVLSSLEPFMECR